jgi:hypothetical protein
MFAPVSRVVFPSLSLALALSQKKKKKKKCVLEKLC